MSHTFRIPTDELLAAAAVSTIATADERAPMGNVLLDVNGSRRRWSATDSYRLLRYDGGSDTTELRVILSPRLLRFAAFAAAGSDEVTLTVDEGPDALATISGPGGSLQVAERHTEFPDIDSLIADAQRGDAHCTVDAEELRQFVSLARSLPIDAEDSARPEPLFWLGISDGHLAVIVDWYELGTAEHTLNVPAEGNARAAANPRLLLETLLLFEGELELILPAEESQPIIMTSADRTALLMPVSTGVEILRKPVEDVLTEVFGELARYRDHDGDYPLVRVGTPVYARLAADTPPRLQVFAVVLRGVEPTLELLTELNDHNVSIGFARVMLVGDQVLAEVDLVADSLDAVEIHTAVARIRRISDELAPMLRALHGGTSDDAFGYRWALYRHAIVVAELHPETPVQLNGPGALEEWSLPELLHVITAWDPQGADRPEDLNRQANLELATEVLRLGGGFVRAQAGALDGSYSEPSMVIWGLSTDDAVALGRRFEQDAIFAITAESMELISCTTDAKESWPRVVATEAEPDGETEPDHEAQSDGEPES
jgi:hypothetical protein